VHRSRLRSTLVVAQAALSVVLLVGAVLFIRSLQNVKAHDVGYAVDRLTFADASFDTRDSVRDEAYPNQLAAIEQSIARIPGVEAVALTSMRPMYGFSSFSYFPDADTVAHKKTMLIFTAVSPSFFATTGMKILRGKGFESRGPLSVVVNEQFARSLWPNENPIGRCIRIESATAPCTTIVGVAQTAILGSLDEKPYAQAYVPLDNSPVGELRAQTAIVRVAPEQSATVQRSLRELIRASFPGSIPRLSTMGESMAPEYRPWDLGARLFTLFGGLALLVAAVGVYSTVSYAVNQRTHEFGVRIALGARAADVLQQVLGEGMRTIAIGIVVGVLLTLAAGRLVAALLYGIAPSDPISLTIVSMLLITIALVAAVVPAWRASRADPVSALRAD
jgi:predicted permease